MSSHVFSIGWAGGNRTTWEERRERCQEGARVRVRAKKRVRLRLRVRARSVVRRVQGIL